ncbi:MAG: sigma-70 family RNA polymerase sigma factor [bacterium]|nr:sigma-70 family RNA polymerase sigma factor [bacterium]
MKTEYDIFEKKVIENLNEKNKISMQKIDKIGKELNLSEEDINVYVYYLFGKQPKTNKDVFRYSKNDSEFNEVSNPIIRYYRDNAKFKPLSREEEIYYAKLKEQGDKNAIDVLLMSNMKFVLMVSSSYSNRFGIGVDDLAQDAVIGMLEAIKKYDYKQGRLLSYAIYYIKVYIERSITCKYKTIKVPVGVEIICSKIKALFFEFQKKYDRNPSYEEITDYLDLSLEDVKFYYNVIINENVASLNAPIGVDNEGENTLSDIIASNAFFDDDYEEVEFELSMKEDIKRAICGDVFEKYNQQEIQSIIEFCRAYELKKNILTKKNEENIASILENDNLLNELKLNLPKYKESILETKFLYFYEYAGLKKYDIFIKTYGLYGNEKMTCEQVGEQYCTSRQFISSSNYKTLEKVKRVINEKYPQYKEMIRG